MKRLVFISNWLYLFSLSLWVAGMFLLGILVEIMVRVNLQDQKLVASTIMNKIMDVFNINIIYTCVTIMILAEVVKFLIKKYSTVGVRTSGGDETSIHTRSFSGHHDSFCYLYR